MAERDRHFEQVELVTGYGTSFVIAGTLKSGATVLKGQLVILESAVRPATRCVLSAWLVIVPDMGVSAGRDQIEWSARQLADRSKYRSKSLEQLFIEAFEAQRDKLEQPRRG